MEFTRCLRCMKEATSYPCPHCGYDPATAKGSDYGLRPGTILNGKYVVGTILGQGGFGITYVGWDLALDCKVAIKEYYPSGQVVRDSSAGSILHWLSTPQSEAARNMGKEMFLKEARKMTRVRNIPQVVHVHDLFQENDTAYIVMDYVEGKTLKAHLATSGPLRWEQAQAIFFPAIRSMAQVHEAGLVHRDLSPDNLMLTPEGSVQILDLGAAKDLNINSGASSMQVAKGGFSPLEQYSQRGGSGPWTDVYAMAATMYYSLTGVLPPNAVDRVDEDPIRWDLPQLAALPQNVLAALKEALAVTAKARTQSMGELLEQLSHSGTSKKQPKAAKYVKKEKRKKSPLLIAFLGMVLVLALAALWMVSPREQPAEAFVPETYAPAAPVEETIAPPAPAETEATVAPTHSEDEILLVTPYGWETTFDLYTLVGNFAEAYPYITVNVVTVSYSDYPEYLQVRLEGGDAPDIAGVSSYRASVETLANMGMGVDISKYMSAERFSAYSQETLSPMTLDGIVYGLPLPPFSEEIGLMALGDSNTTQEHLENVLLLMDYICTSVYESYGIEY